MGFESLPPPTHLQFASKALRNEFRHYFFSQFSIISIVFTIVQQTGFYDQGCREWKRKPPNEKTWNSFKFHFIREFKETRGVQQANHTNRLAANSVAIEQANAAMITELTQDHTESLTNLATETSTERGAMAT